MQRAARPIPFMRPVEQPLMAVRAVRPAHARNAKALAR